MGRLRLRDRTPPGSKPQVLCPSPGRSTRLRASLGQGWKAGSPSNPGCAPTSSYRGPRRRARLEAADTHVIIHSDMWTGSVFCRGQAFSGPLGIVSFSTCEPSLDGGLSSSLGPPGKLFAEVSEGQRRETALPCPALVRPEQVGSECWSGQAEEVGTRGCTRAGGCSGSRGIRGKRILRATRPCGPSSHLGLSFGTSVPAQWPRGASRTSALLP